MIQIPLPQGSAVAPVFAAYYFQLLIEMKAVSQQMPLMEPELDNPPSDSLDSSSDSDPESS
jgi:hypothetical protein